VGSKFQLVMGKSIRIDSAGRIYLNRLTLPNRRLMKNFDSVPQLKRFSYVHHCAARSRHGSHSRQCGHSLLQRQLAALLQCGRPVMASVDWSSSFRTRVQNPCCGLWRGFWQSNESNRIESNRLVCDIESNRM